MGALTKTPAHVCRTRMPNGGLRETSGVPPPNPSASFLRRALRPFMHNHFQQRLITDPFPLRDFTRLSQIWRRQPQSDLHAIRLSELGDQLRAWSFLSRARRFRLQKLAAFLAASPTRLLFLRRELRRSPQPQLSLFHCVTLPAIDFPACNRRSRRSRFCPASNL